MADNAFDRVTINERERPISSDIARLQSQLDRTLRDLLMHQFLGRNNATSDISGNPVSGFIGDGFKVRQASPLGLSVTISAGIGFQDLAADIPAAVGGLVGMDDLCRYKPLALLAPVTIVGIPAGPAPGTNRIDIVEVRMNRVLGNPLSRDILNTTSGVFVPTSVFKTLAMTLDGSTGTVNDPASSTAAISYKVGINAGAEPSVTAGYVKIATIFSNNGNMTTQVTRGNIIDRRNTLFVGNRMEFSASGIMPTAGQPTLSTFSAPAGIEAVVTRGAALNQFTLRLIGGGAPTIAPDVTANITGGGYFAASLEVLRVISKSVGTLSSGDVTDLADATKSHPALAFAEGSPVTVIACAANRISSGTVDDIVFNPVGWSLVGSQMRA